MKLAIISDIHANLEAFEAVLADIEKRDCEKIYCLGDVVGYGCDPRACVELVEKHCAVKLLGNHDHYSLGLYENDNFNEIAKMSHKWTKSELTDFELTLIENYEMEFFEDSIHFVHASPNGPNKWRYLLSAEDAEAAFVNMDKNICFVGHTHIPTIFIDRANDLPRMKVGHDITIDTEQKYIVNVGSVGQPRDNDPDASYVTFDSELGDLFFRRVKYDVEKTQQKMAKAQLPELLIKRIAIGR